VKVYQVLAMLLFTVAIGFSQETPPSSNDQTIDDDDKVSSRINDMIVGVDDAQKGMDAVSTGKQGVDLAKNLKNLNLQQIKDDAVNALKNTVVQYKNSKQSFIQLMDSVTTKITRVLDQASQRVNMWRTTEPSLIAFGQGMKQMADNTIKVFSEFEPKDLLDIDRKWDRQMEGQLANDQKFVVGMIYFLSTTAALKSRDAFNSIFLDDGLQDQMTSTTLGVQASVIQMTVPVHTYRQIPSAAMHRASEAIEVCGTISAQSHDVSGLDPSMSNEQADFNKIQQTLTDPKQTYEDAQEMSAMIALRRQTVSTQTTQLQQTLSMLQADIARMYLNDQEKISMQTEQVTNSLKILSGGAPFPTIDDALKGSN
jgi:hypothetical protein